MIMNKVHNHIHATISTQTEVLRMTAKDIEKDYGICGLVCSFCSYNVNCSGCRCKDDNCEIKTCCGAKGLQYCFECGEWPCDKDMHNGIRIRAFNTVAKNEGLDALAEYLHINLSRGITYHRADKLSGDYDRCKTEQEVIDLLKCGKPDPYDVCPTYESEHFLLRFVSLDDAPDLLECYKNPTVSVQGNSENCDFGYGSQTLDEMLDFINRWLEAYKVRGFIRFSIIDKQKNRAIGTIEIFGGGHNNHSVLRIDNVAGYENEKALSELLKIADSFFHDIDCKKIVTKVMPEATQRMKAVTQNGYAPYPANDEWDRNDYYMKLRAQI